MNKRYGGSGLGLSIAKGLVENMKGEIWVDSKKGEGSTFYFSIPYQVYKKDGTKKQTENKKKIFVWPNKTILIVEDAVISYELLTKFLKDSQVNFLHATNGEQAVDLCKNNNHIDLVLMDIQLPIMNGLEATARIKELKPSLPIIAQTANAMDDERPKILKAGCDAYVLKPINRNELLQTIAKYI